MKSLTAIFALVAVVALMTVPVALADSCSKSASASSCGSSVKQTSATSCGSTATAASAASCAAMCAGKKTASASTCGTQASSSAACADMMGCDPTSAMAAACKAGVIDCKSTRVLYRVQVDGKPYDTANRGEAYSIVGRNGSSLQYVVNGQAHDTERDAMMALVSQLESQVNAFLTFQTVGESSKSSSCAATCSAKAKSAALYRVAGREFNCDKTARAIQAKAAAAVESLKITHGEDGQTLMVGNQVAETETDARLLLAQSKLNAVLETVWGES